MCFSSRPPSPPETKAPPPPPPPPTVIPTSVSEMSTQETNRKKQINQLRYGLASTIKTSPLGIAGKGSDLTSNQSQGKQSLGA